MLPRGLTSPAAGKAVALSCPLSLGIFPGWSELPSRASQPPLTGRNGVTQARPFCPNSIHSQGPPGSGAPHGPLRPLASLHQSPTTSAHLCFLPFFPQGLISRELSNQLPTQTLFPGDLMCNILVRRNHLPNLSVL